VHRRRCIPPLYKAGSHTRHHCSQGHVLILPLPRLGFDLLHCPPSFSCDAPAPRQLRTYGPLNLHRPTIVFPQPVKA
jgi:hypothetical protein